MEKATITTLVLILLACVLPTTQGHQNPKFDGANVSPVQISVQSPQSETAPASRRGKSEVHYDFSSFIEKHRKTIKDKIDAKEARCIAIGVVQGDDVVWAEGFGNAGQSSSEINVNRETNFAVMSLSKLMTALAISRAMQEGYLDLDQPISNYLPDLNLNSPFEDRPEDTITLRHLLCHRAGFPHFVEDITSYEKKSYREYIKAIETEPLIHKVDDQTAYSNSGYDLAGHILAKVYGKTFEESMEELLFAPLKMEQSTFDYDEVVKNKERAIGYNEDSPVLPVKIPCFASGGGFSNINDMIKLMKMILSEGKTKDGIFLKREYFERVLSPRGILKDQESQGYALGIFKGENRYKKRVFPIFTHTGEGWGYTCDLLLCLELRLGLVILANAGGYDLRWRGQLTDDLYRILFSSE